MNTQTGLYFADDFICYGTEWFSYGTFWQEVKGKLYQRGIQSMNEFLMNGLGVSRTTLWRWQKGRGETPVSVIYMLSDILEINLENHRQRNFDAAKMKAVFEDVWPKRF